MHGIVIVVLFLTLFLKPKQGQLNCETHYFVNNTVLVEQKTKKIDEQFTLGGPCRKRAVRIVHFLLNHLARRKDPFT